MIKYLLYCDIYIKNTRPLYEKFEKNYFVPIAIANVFMPTLGLSPYKKTEPQKCSSAFCLWQGHKELISPYQILFFHVLSFHKPPIYAVLQPFLLLRMLDCFCANLRNRGFFGDEIIQKTAAQLRLFSAV